MNKEQKELEYKINMLRIKMEYEQKLIKEKEHNISLLKDSISHSIEFVDTLKNKMEELIIELKKT